mmetsp:Transcript_22982/g.54537  ORF Transcript_22982/g.54537 Transcript_22982/m.54537 type:complete len:126 (-) Transcript_22982:72-449(-)
MSGWQLTMGWQIIPARRQIMGVVVLMVLCCYCHFGGGLKTKRIQPQVQPWNSTAACLKCAVVGVVVVFRTSKRNCGGRWYWIPFRDQRQQQQQQQNTGGDKFRSFSLSPSYRNSADDNSRSCRKV